MRTWPEYRELERKALHEMRRDYLANAIADCDTQTEASSKMRVHRAALARMLNELGITPPWQRQEEPEEPKTIPLKVSRETAERIRQTGMMAYGETT